MQDSLSENNYPLKIHRAPFKEFHLPASIYFQGLPGYGYVSGRVVILNLENLGKYYFFRQLWLVLGVKLMEINSNLFSRNFIF